MLFIVFAESWPSIVPLCINMTLIVWRLHKPSISSVFLHTLWVVVSWMDAGPSGQIHMSLQEQWLQQRQPPPTSAAPAMIMPPYIHFPPGQPAVNAFNPSNDYYDPSRPYDFHGANSGGTVYSWPCDLPSNSQQCLPFHQFSVPSMPSGKDGAAVSNSGRKRTSSSAKSKQAQRPQKHPRVPAVPTTEPPSSICGVGPPVSMDKSSPPSTPVRSSVTGSHSASASFRLPSYKQCSMGKSAATTDVWYFCHPENSPNKPSDWQSCDTNELLTQRPRTPYISCTLCL